MVSRTRVEITNRTQYYAEHLCEGLKADECATNILGLTKVGDKLYEQVVKSSGKRPEVVLFIVRSSTGLSCSHFYKSIASICSIWETLTLVSSIRLSTLKYSTLPRRPHRENGEELSKALKMNQFCLLLATFWEQLARQRVY